MTNRLASRIVAVLFLIPGIFYIVVAIGGLLGSQVLVVPMTLGPLLVSVAIGIFMGAGWATGAGLVLSLAFLSIFLLQLISSVTQKDWGAAFPAFVGSAINGGAAFVLLAERNSRP